MSKCSIRIRSRNWDNSILFQTRSKERRQSRFQSAWRKRAQTTPGKEAREADEKNSKTNGKRKATDWKTERGKSGEEETKERGRFG